MNWTPLSLALSSSGLETPVPLALVSGPVLAAPSSITLTAKRLECHSELGNPPAVGPALPASSMVTVPALGSVTAPILNIPIALLARDRPPPMCVPETRVNLT